jgi:SWI/SNF-related matrix-associated actin-dependent regulator 1 of chromatin subfamily A
VTNRPAEYASQLDVLGKLNAFGGLWGFYRRYCGAYRDRFGQWNISGNSNLDELNEKLRGNCYIRRTKDQVLKDLPPVRHANIIVAGSPTQMAEYRKAERDIVEYLMERAKQIALELGTSPGSAAVVAKIKAEANEHLVRISVLRRLAAKAKMDSVVEFIESHKEAGLKVVVAAHHRDVVDEIANKFGGLKIQGGMLVEEVEAAKSRFQEESTEDAPVIVLSIQAAKTGHTLTASQDVLFVELPWTPADVDQTYSRCHRLGQKGSVTATYLLCEGTVDEEIYNLISRKRGVVNAATDGGAVGKREDSVGQMLVGLFAERGLSKI